MTASGSYRLMDKFIPRLMHRIWEVATAIGHRRELTRLADHDDRMLADVGLNRRDLCDARSEPFWLDPTTVLQQRRAPSQGARKQTWPT
jgi:uncharacterized protein YjiS (DUF1127 family)